MGCYVEASWRTEQRIMVDLQDYINSTRVRDTAQTVTKCASICASYSLPYAGLQSATECYCSAADPTISADEADEAECASSCGGESTTACGRNWVADDSQWGYTARTSIYHIEDMSKIL